MKHLMLIAAALGALSTPAFAQSRADEARMDAAQRRFDSEVTTYRQAVDQYRASRGRGGPGGYNGPVGGPGGGPVGGPGGGSAYYDDDRYENGYDAARYYREGGNYQERTLASDERVYRGNDGRYYCKRSDGTTGLVLGAAGGGLLGNVIDGGHSRAAGTLIGAAIGALAGRAVEQNQQQIRCR